MAIVDLRGREHEPEVTALLASDPAWMLIGWSEDDRIIACAGVERLSADELAIRAVGAHQNSHARALIVAITRLATGSRIVAEASGTFGELYRDCAFALERTGSNRVRWVYTLDEPAAESATVRAATLQETEAAIRAAWGRDTSDDPDEWSPENPARGQCAVTALLLRELLGGEILIASVLRDGRPIERHAWNRLPSGLTLDLTRDQFRHGEVFGEPAVEEPVLTDRHPERLAKLRKRMRARLVL
jgi:hypothetical protein